MKVLNRIVSNGDHNIISVRHRVAGLAGVLAVAIGLVAVTFGPGRAIASGAASQPRVLVCAGTPVTRPTKMAWCSSACSSYMTGIVWKSWTVDGANGVGTLMTNDGVPNCGQGTWTKHPGSGVILGNAHVTEYCTDTGGHAKALLFTVTNLWGGASLPASGC
jgi:hypothetical protein